MTVSSEHARENQSTLWEVGISRHQGRGDTCIRRIGGTPVNDIGLFELQSPQSTDFNSDGNVDGGDLDIWQGGFGTPSGANLNDGDANGDVDVDVNDFLIWQSSFGRNEPMFIESEYSLGTGFRNDNVDSTDLDNDGDLDALVTTRNDSLQVWFNEGNDNYVQTGQSFGSAASVYAALGDIDNDGDINAVVAVVSTGVALQINDGNGIFTSAQSLASSSPIDVALADVNRDGKRDIFIAQR